VVLPLSDIMEGFERVSSESIQLLASELLDNATLTLVMLGRIGTPTFSLSDIIV